MVYKRPTDFIPRMPSRTNDYDDDSFIEPPLEDFLSALPDEGKCKGGDGFEDFLESLNTEPNSVGRWASSSSLDYYSGEDDEASAKKARQKVRFASVEVRKYKVCEEIKSSHGERTLRSLDWEHSDSELVNVDQYEAGKDETTSTTRVKRTRPRRLSPPQRKEIIDKAKELSGLMVPLRLSSPVRERTPVIDETNSLESRTD